MVADIGHFEDVTLGEAALDAEAPFESLGRGEVIEIRGGRKKSAVQRPKIAVAGRVFRVR
jgi:hypothetical protein